MPDTNCMVALLLPWHEHHARAKAETERRLDDGEILVLAAHTLVEAYTVLTRLPAPIAWRRPIVALCLRPTSHLRLSRLSLYRVRTIAALFTRRRRIMSRADAFTMPLSPDVHE